MPWRLTGTLCLSGCEEDSLTQWNLGLGLWGSNCVESDELDEVLQEEGPASGIFSYRNEAGKASWLSCILSKE